jgi:hypothetical protein
MDDVRERLEALIDASRVASVMVDGDEAQRIITARAMHYLAHPDPDYRFMVGDYYDVDHAAFLRMKKTLLRLERLLDFPCSTALWVRVEVAGLERHVTLAVQNGSVHRYYRFGQEKIALAGEMARCMENGQTIVVPLEDQDHVLTVLSPVFDSLGDVVGVVELSAVHPGSDALPPAWS